MYDTKPLDALTASALLVAVRCALFSVYAAAVGGAWDDESTLIVWFGGRAGIDTSSVSALRVLVLINKQPALCLIELCIASWRPLHGGQPLAKCAQTGAPSPAHDSVCECDNLLQEIY